MQRPTSPITHSIDVLYTLLLFYEFTLPHWSQSTISYSLWLLVTLVTLVDWMSTRAVYDLYSVSFLILDLVAVFTLTHAARFATITDSQLGYDSRYWVAFSILSIVYAIWDFQVSGQQGINQRQVKSLRLWGWLMVTSAVVTLGTFFALHLWQEGHPLMEWPQSIAMWITMPALGFWYIMQVMWLRIRFTAQSGK